MEKVCHISSWCIASREKEFLKKGMSSKKCSILGVSVNSSCLCDSVHKDKLFLPGHGVQQDLMQEGWVNYILKNPLFSDT